MDLAKSVYLGNLPFDANEDMIHSALGDISAEKVIVARNSKGLFMGYAFAELTSVTEIEAAVSKLHRSSLGKKMPRKIHVEPGLAYSDLLERIGL